MYASTVAEIEGSPKFKKTGS